LLEQKSKAGLSRDMDAVAARPSPVLFPMRMRKPAAGQEGHSAHPPSLMLELARRTRECRRSMGKGECRRSMGKGAASRDCLGRQGFVTRAHSNAQPSMVSVPADVPLGASCDCLCGDTKRCETASFKASTVR